MSDEPKTADAEPDARTPHETARDDATAVAAGPHGLEIDALRNLARCYLEMREGVRIETTLPRPTLAQLEAILNSEEDVEIDILPSGEIRAKGGGKGKPITLKEDLGGEYDDPKSIPIPTERYEPWSVQCRSKAEAEQVLADHAAAEHQRKSGANTAEDGRSSL